MFLIGIAGKAAAADEDPDVDIPVVETLVVPNSKKFEFFKVTRSSSCPFCYFQEHVHFNVPVPWRWPSLSLPDLAEL